MKNLILMTLFSLCAISIAKAESFKIHQTLANQFSVEKIEFAINQNLNRVWVAIELGDGNYKTQSYETYIKNLFYDKDTSSIVFLLTNGKKVVCSEIIIRGKGLFKKANLENTGNCYFSQQYQDKFLEIYLNVNEN